jgi:hypothetical protein
MKRKKKLTREFWDRAEANQRRLAERIAYHERKLKQEGKTRQQA